MLLLASPSTPVYYSATTSSRVAYSELPWLRVITLASLSKELHYSPVLTSPVAWSLLPWPATLPSEVPSSSEAIFVGSRLKRRGSENRFCSIYFQNPDKRFILFLAVNHNLREDAKNVKCTSVSYAIFTLNDGNVKRNASKNAWKQPCYEIVLYAICYHSNFYTKKYL